ncbi:MAG: PHP domain-containing protein [Candidatus Lokiarchaeota archaeon]|nr:PHP domain-containing protein [Candidatus Lokiarchaeota archaeon]MBD3201221.1 PHP domain-containing protein [Candidatus Lokiarchaeota archaeon]
MISLNLDLHVHSIYSGDSIIKPNDIIKYGKLKGLDGVAICDHNTLKAYKKLKGKDEDFILIPGMEIETNIGEVIGLFLSEDFTLDSIDFFDVVREIKASDGIIVLPHPFDKLRSNHIKLNLLNDRLIKKYIDGIETLNSRVIINSYNRKAKEIARKFNLFETAGSDAHHPKEIGNAYTLLDKIDDLSFEGIKNTFKSRRSKSMGTLSSPLYHFITVYNKLKKGLYF